MLWMVIGGGRVQGTVVELGFGGRIPRSPSIPNPKLPEEYRDFNAEFGLMIYCAWRVESGDEILAGCYETTEEGACDVSPVESLIGRTVVHAKVSQPGFDLKIEFNDGRRIALFCDQTEEDEANYSFFVDDLVYSVVGKGVIEVEPAGVP